MFRRKRVVGLPLSVAVVLLLVVLLGGGYAVARLGGAFRPAASGDIELQKGLVGHWKFDGDAKDATPFANNGTVTAATLTTDKKAQTNRAYSFDGSTAYMSMGSASSLNTGTTISVSAWFYPTSNAVYQPIVSKVPAGFATGWEMANSSGVYRVTLRNSTLNIQTTAVSLNQWHLITFTYDGTTLTLYADGVSVGSTTGSATPDSAANFMVATRAADISNKFSGSIDDVRMYNRAISATEVAALYKQYDAVLSLGDGQRNLVAWYKLDGNAKDASPRALNATVSGTAALTTDRKAKANSAYIFDGTSSCINRSAGGGLSITGAVSVGAWIYPTGTGTTQSIVRSGTGTDLTYQISYNGTSKLLTFAWYDGAFKSLNTASNTVLLNTWSHVLVTRDASNNVIMYVNGTQSTTGSATTPINAASSFSIGATICNVNQQYTGTIDDVRVYNSDITAAEIASIASSYDESISMSSLQKGLVGDWPLNGNAKDATPYGSNGTVTSGTLAVDRKGRTDGAYSFSGVSGQRINVSSTGPYNSFGMNSFTVSSWIKTAESSNQRCIFSTAGGAQGYRFGYQVGRPYYLVGDGAQYQEGTIGTTTLNDNSWHHLVITYVYSSNWTVTSYIDGVNTGSVSLPSTIDSVNNAAANMASMTGSGTNGVVNGVIDDVRIWKRELSAVEIAALYKNYR